MHMNSKKIKTAILLYVTLPVFIFLMGYLQWYWAIPMVCALTFAFCRALRDNQSKGCANVEILISKRELAAWFAFVLVFTHLCGMNGFWYQTADWFARNAIYKDIITRPWPVYYEGHDTALSYYIGFWLVPAIPAKAAYMLFGTNAGWMMGRFTLWLWSALGVWLLLLGAFVFLDAGTRKMRLAIGAVLLGFSGLDVVGMVITSSYYLLGMLHLEWWAPHQFSSITTCLCWVFNQTIIPWLCILLFLMEKDCRNYLLIGVCCLLCGPFPFVGLVILMVAQFAAKAVRDRNLRLTLKEMFSAQNVSILLFVFPLIALYLLGNNAATAGMKTGEVERSSFGAIAAFLLLDAGIYLMLLWKEQKRNPLYYAVIATILVCPFIRFGGGDDFCMRSSVPAVLMMALWCAGAVSRMARDGLPRSLKQRIVSICLLIALTFGAVTPGIEIFRGFYYVAKSRTIFLEFILEDSIEDFSTISLNFEASAPTERPFFRYFAKPLVGKSEADNP